jgi:2-dehydropantoate 2-reductase
MNRQTPAQSNWHVLGAGAMGCWWGSRLIKQGHQVTLLVRNQPPVETRIIVEHNHHQECFDCQALRLETALPPESTTALLVTLKAHHTLDALTSISDLLPYYQVIVLMQNGMGVVEQIRHAFPGLPLLIGITNQGAYRLAALHPLHIVQAGQGDTWLGCLPEEAAQTRVDAVTDLIEMSPGPVRWDPYILGRQWTKLAVNCVINGLTVIENCRNGELTLPAHRERIAILCEEIEAVMSHYVDRDPMTTLQQEVLRVAAATRENFSSMLQDAQNGRTTEVDYLNGYLCNRADDLNLAVPANQELYAEIRAAVSTENAL